MKCSAKGVPGINKPLSCNAVETLIIRDMIYVRDTASIYGVGDPMYHLPGSHNRLQKKNS